MYDSSAYLAWWVATTELVMVVMLSGLLAQAASMERTAAAMSQCAARIRESSSDVKDFDASLTMLIVDSNSSGAGAAITVIRIDKLYSFWT